jgi:hypothetical protein
MFFLAIFAIIRTEKINLRFHALAYHLLNAMIDNGNIGIHIRKSELDYLSKTALHSAVQDNMDELT